MAHNLRSRMVPKQPLDEASKIQPKGVESVCRQTDHAESSDSRTEPPSSSQPINHVTDTSTVVSPEMDTLTPILLQAQEKLPPQELQPLPWHKMLIVLVLFRWVNAFLTQTFYVPDEYWQSLEVAHNIVFGNYGYLTWEWRTGLRGFTHPVLFAILYKALHLLNLDFPVLLVVLPKVMQATFSAFGDYHVYKLAQCLWGERPARWALFSHLSSWFVFYTAARTLTNTMEMILTVCALCYYPWPVYMLKGSNVNQQRFLTLYLLLASLACIMRPTAAIIWIPLCLWHLARCRNAFLALLVDFIPMGTAALSCSLLMDRICYGKWVFVQVNFLRLNTLYNVASFYGVQPWHWYLSQGIPVIMGTHVFPFTLGIRLAGRSYRPLVLLLVWIHFIYSLLQHKEHRFLLPLVPIAMSFCGVCLSHLSKSGRATTLAIFILATNLPVSLYTGIIHQRGTLDVMGFIQTVAHAPNVHIRVPSVLFLMPCHSTPFYSHVHANISMRFLECPPSLSRYQSDDTLYQDEADVFYDNPSEWLKSEFRPGSNLPRYLVFYDVLLPKIQRFVKVRGYSQVASFFHSHIPLESRLGRYVLVYARPLKIPLEPA